MDRALGSQVAGPAVAALTGGAMSGIGAVASLVQSIVGGSAPANTSKARVGDTSLVVKVMIDDRELGEAMIPHIDKRVLGTV